MFARSILTIIGAIFVAFGLWALIAPDSLATLVHFNLPDNIARTEMRAFYGGVEIGFGVFLMLSAMHTASHRTALLGSACLLTAVAICRIIGIAIDGSGGATLMLGALASEIFGAALSWVAWKKTPV